MRPNLSPQQTYQLYDLLSMLVEEEMFDNVPDFKDDVYQITDALRDALLGCTAYNYLCESCGRKWEIIGKLVKHPEKCPTCIKPVTLSGRYVFKK